jgi:hypothetical protein
VSSLFIRPQNKCKELFSLAKLASNQRRSGFEISLAEGSNRLRLLLILMPPPDEGIVIYFGNVVSWKIETKGNGRNIGQEVAVHYQVLSDLAHYFEEIYACVWIKFVFKTIINSQILRTWLWTAQARSINIPSSIYIIIQIG